MPFHRLRPLPLLFLSLGIAAAHAQTMPAAPQPSEMTLTILHTNDVHGHILPFAYTEIGRSPKEQPSVGGDARRATLIRQIKARTKNPTIVVDSGDTFTRGPFTNTYLGIADVEAMNAIGYEIAAFGNNEFKAKDGAEDHDATGAQSALLAIVKRSRFPWLCANATNAQGAMLEGVQPFVVRQFGPLRVGFLGLTAPRVATYPQAQGWTIADPIQTAQKYIPLARAQCDILIAVTHIGVDLDKKLASATTGLDAIVGGDSHTYLYNAVEVKNADGSQAVPIVQDGEFGVNLGEFDLHFVRNGTAGWKLTDYKYALLPVGPELTEAPDVAATVAPFAAPLMAVVGKLPTDRIGQTPDDRSRLTTQVFVDAMRQRSKADFAFNPVGTGFFETFRSPTVRLFDIYSVMPFRDHIVLATMTGAAVKALADSRKDNVISGDMSSIDPAKSYTVAFVDFVASSEYKMKTEQVSDTGADLGASVIAYVRDLH